MRDIVFVDGLPIFQYTTTSMIEPNIQKIELASSLDICNLLSIDYIFPIDIFVGVHQNGKDHTEYESDEYCT